MGFFEALGFSANTDRNCNHLDSYISEDEADNKNINRARCMNITGQDYYLYGLYFR